MRSEKKNLIVVTYGFHPQEYFAEEVGKRIREMNLEDIVVVRFRPKCMPENIKELYEKGTISWKSKEKIDEDGRIERRDFLDKNYPELGAVIHLHDDYSIDRKHFQITLTTFYHPRSRQIQTKELKKLARLLKKIYKGEVTTELWGHVPPKGLRYNDIILDFLLPRIEGEKHRIYYSKEALKKKEVQDLLDKGVDFTKRYILWVKRYYLNPEREFYEVSQLYQ